MSWQGAGILVDVYEVPVFFRTLKATHEFPYFVRAFSKSGPVLEVFLVGKGESMYNSIHSADFVIMDCRENSYTW